MSRTSLLMPLDGNTYRLCNTKLLLHKVILGAPKEKRFQELALKTLKSRRLFRLYCMNTLIIPEHQITLLY